MAKTYVVKSAISLLLLACGRALAEAPAGAVPSTGTEAWYADYELNLRPEDAGASAIPWRLSAWQFQEDLANFYHYNGRPPLNPAYFTVMLPDAIQMQILQECPGLLISAAMLIAQVRLSAGDCSQAMALLQQAFQWLSDGQTALQPFALKEHRITEIVMKAAVMLPGWNVEAAVQRFLEKESSCSPAHVLKSCEDAKLDIVVAVCREDLSWLASFTTARIWIYAKCGLEAAQHPEHLLCVTKEDLPNLAMESLAYATHLERRYDSFADYTFFLQGAPFEHASPRLVQDAASAIQAGHYSVPFLHLNSRRFLAGSSFCLRDLYSRLLDAPAPEVFGSYCCSQFLVRRDRLLARPQALYARIVAILSGDFPLACAQDVKYDPRPRIAVSALFEHLWHVVLGEPPLLTPRRSNQRLPLFAQIDITEGALPDALKE